MNCDPCIKKMDISDEVLFNTRMDIAPEGLEEFEKWVKEVNEHIEDYL